MDEFLTKHSGNTSTSAMADAMPDSLKEAAADSAPADEAPSDDAQASDEEKPE